MCRRCAFDLLVCGVGFVVCRQEGVKSARRFRVDKWASASNNRRSERTRREHAAHQADGTGAVFASMSVTHHSRSTEPATVATLPRAQRQRPKQKHARNAQKIQLEEKSVTRGRASANANANPPGKKKRAETRERSGKGENERQRENGERNKQVPSVRAICGGMNQTNERGQQTLLPIDMRLSQTLGLSARIRAC